MNLLTFIFLFAGLALFIICWAWVIAELKFRKFNNDCIYIEESIRKSVVTVDNYKQLLKDCSRLECTNDQDRRRKRSIWVSIEFKFKAVSDHHLTENQLLNICAG